MDVVVRDAVPVDGNIKSLDPFAQPMPIDITIAHAPQEEFPVVAAVRQMVGVSAEKIFV